MRSRLRFLTVPVEYHKLDNLLRVVLSGDTNSPQAAAAIYDDIGFCLA